ncbi:MAG: gliding motility-associated ABC transporter substrate-binding protein GldG [Flavobacteriaceae bacterium]|nr:gliding motility-associated ABC transporter substrate-binding protein GldG [Flavobacteriaceae bacterium]
MKKKQYLPIIYTLLAILIANIIGSFLHLRWDLTDDQRYTLSETSEDILSGFDTPVVIDVLLEGSLPPEFQKLRLETQLLLEEMAYRNPMIKYNFVAPLEGDNNTQQTISQLQQMGLTPTSVQSKEGGSSSQEIIFPWAIANYGKKSVRVPLLKNKLGATVEERINNSIQQMEYSFANALKTLSITNKKKIAILKGNGELEDIQIADYLTELKAYYNIGAVTLDSATSNPQKLLQDLREFDMAIVAKPTKRFSEEQKYVLDQYILGGGKSIWLVDAVAMELDSLMNEKGSALAMPYDLNLTDFFFSYGLRIEPQLIKDMYHTQIVLASGQDNNSQYQPLPWLYAPMVFSKNSHAISTNLEALRFQFTSPISLLKSNNQQSVLLASSALSKPIGIPSEIQLASIQQPPKRETFVDKGNMPLAVLVEGNFESMYQHRVKPFAQTPALETGENNQMILISDGDLIRNQIRNGRPLELGYDKWTNNFFGNKEFLLNCANYLLQDDGLINIRTKKVQIPFLDSKRIEKEKNKWQLINIGFPIVCLLLFGLGFGILRRKKYGR